MILDLSALKPAQVYFHMIQTLVPRPIAWVLSEIEQVPDLQCPRPEGAFYVFPDASRYLGRMSEERTISSSTDLCLHLLERHKGLKLTALDRSAARLEKVAENLDRIGLADGARLLAADAAEPEAWWDGQRFDRILLDAPCTATGVIRRHPEIKWLRDTGQVDSALAQQRRLLDALWPLLAHGGMLLYATCSVLRAENECQVRDFAATLADAALDPIDGPWGRDTGHGRQILPGEEGMDGFFYARIRKTS